ncbi:MAG: hypothetical protein ACTH32_06300 [Microbacterium gubbeenense]|uniref:hypothetical protein n=1 Tax=Microbacterium gubbeenense TaxID=159896 RepID=UPI003F9C719C
MALSSATTDPGEAILELVREQFNGTVTISLDDAEYGPYDPATDERELIKPATVLIDDRDAWVKWQGKPRGREGSYAWGTVWQNKTQFETGPADPFIPAGAVLRVNTHTRDPQLIGQNYIVLGSSVSSLIDLRTVIAEGEVANGR